MLSFHMSRSLYVPMFARCARCCGLRVAGCSLRSPLRVAGCSLRSPLWVVGCRDEHLNPEPASQNPELETCVPELLISS